MLKNREDQEEVVKYRVYNEWKTFIAEMWDYEKQIIVNMSDKIHFYDCVVIFFLDNEQIPEEDICFLFQKEHIISQMWLIYLKHEQIGFLKWSGLEELLKLWREDERG